MADADRIQSEAFLRITQTRGGARLQSRGVTLRDSDGREVSLWACAEVGTQEYYDGLAALCSDDQDCVLYGCVTAEENLVTDATDRRRLARRSSVSL